MIRVSAIAAVLVSSIAEADSGDDFHIFQTDVRRVGGADAGVASMRYHVDVSSTFVLSAVWVRTGRILAGADFAVTASTYNASVTGQLTLVADSWNRWVLPQPLPVIPYAYYAYYTITLTALPGSDIELVNVESYPRYVDPRTGSRHPEFIAAGIELIDDANNSIEYLSPGSILGETSAVDAWTPQGCPSASAVFGFPYESSGEAVFARDVPTTITGIARSEYRYLDQPNVFTSLGFDVVTSDAGSVDYRLRSAGRTWQGSFTPGARLTPLNGLSTPEVDGGPSTFELELTARGGEVHLRTLRTTAPADPCHPVVRATWGGGFARVGTDVTADLVVAMEDCFAVIAYPDRDRDGAGDGRAPFSTCYGFSTSGDWVVNAADCDDGNYDVNPSVREVCDGRDNDCDGLVDIADDDLSLKPCHEQRGVCAGALAPRSLCSAGTWMACGAPEYGSSWEPVEATCDGLDNDCDGTVDDVVRGPLCILQLGVCAGAASATCAEASWQHCSAAEYGPLFEEHETSCDGRDNDCDGWVDAEDDGFVVTGCELQRGVCAGSTHVSAQCTASGWQPCDVRQYGGTYQTLETSCDGRDNDCDGVIDEDCTAPAKSCSSSAAPPGLALLLAVWLAKGSRGTRPGRRSAAR